MPSTASSRRRSSTISGVIGVERTHSSRSSRVIVRRSRARATSELQLVSREPATLREHRFTRRHLISCGRRREPG